MSERQDDTQRRLQAAIAFWEGLKAEKGKTLDSAFYGRVKAVAIEVRVNGLLQTLASWLADSKEGSDARQLSEISLLAVWLVEQLEERKCDGSKRDFVRSYIRKFCERNQSRTSYRMAVEKSLLLLDHVKLVGEAWK